MTVKQTGAENDPGLKNPRRNVQERNTRVILYYSNSTVHVLTDNVSIRMIQYINEVL